MWGQKSACMQRVAGLGLRVPVLQYFMPMLNFKHTHGPIDFLRQLVLEVQHMPNLVFAGSEPKDRQKDGAGL